MASQDFMEMVNAVPDDQFAAMLRMQLESVDFVVLPEGLQVALKERARLLGIDIAIEAPAHS